MGRVKIHLRETMETVKRETRLTSPLYLSPVVSNELPQMDIDGKDLIISDLPQKNLFSPLNDYEEYL